MNNRRFGLVATLVLTLATPGSAWAEVRASLDRNRVYEGDSLTLTIEVQGTTSQQPDLSALRQDFDVVSTASGTQVSIVNGRRSDTTRWQVTLSPRRTGKIQIPALRVGSERTAPLTLTVADASAVPQRDEQVFVEFEADLPSGTAYVQQQVPLTVRLYSAAPLRQGTLTDPRADHAVVERLGEDKRYTAARGGKRYQVIERRYALSPEQSGLLHVPPVVFKGNLPAEGGGRSARRGTAFERFRNDPFFDRFFDNSTLDRLFNEDPFAALEPGRAVAVRSQGLDIQVKPRPETAGNHWLPAEDLVLEDSWAGKAPELRVGEPVTRTLTLRARGLSGSQIPQIPLDAGDAVRVYPETPRSDTRTDGSLIYGTSEQAFALIPERAGQLRLPEIRIQWWDTQANREREAVVPALDAKVRPGVNGTTEAQPPANNRQQSTASELPPTASSQPEQAKDEAPSPARPSPSGLLSTAWLIGALGTALVLVAATCRPARTSRRKRRRWAGNPG